jgi:hypothetical protein
MKIKTGMTVSWMGSNWIVTKVGKMCCALAKPGDPATTGLAFRKEMGLPRPVKVPT